MKVADIQKLSYEYKSHTLNPLVIAAYNNVFKYKTLLTDDMLVVFQQRKTSVFLFTKKVPEIVKTFKSPVIYCEYPVSSKLTDEYVYNIEKVLTTDDSEIRRGIRFAERPEIELVEVTNSPEHLRTKNMLFLKWLEHKTNDPNTYQMTFNPNRYKRAIGFKQIGLETVEYIYKVRGIPYGVAIFAVGNDCAYMIATYTLHFNKQFHVVSNMGEYFTISTMVKLQEKGIKYMNYGPSGGIKGLKVYKDKFAHSSLPVYTL